MRLLVVSQYFWPETFKINDIVAEMTARGHEVTVLTGKPNYPEGRIFPDFAKAPDKFSHFGKAEIIRLPMFARGHSSIGLALNYLSFAISGMLLAPFMLRKRPFDAILICLLSPVTSALPAIRMRHLRRIPSAMWVLDLWPQSLDAVGVLNSKRALSAIGRLVKYIYRRTDLIFGQSKSFVSEIAKYLPDDSTVGYLPSWPDNSQSSYNTEPAPELPSRPDLFNIVFTGNIGEAQDFPSIIETVDLLRDEPIRWIIVGDGRKSEWLATEISLRHLEDKVIMTGRFSPERMASFYAHADALLVALRPSPIFSMTIPAKVQSYLGAGKPILAMLDGEGAEVIRDAEAGYAVAAGDSVALADATRRLMQASGEERKRMALNGAAYAAREFDRNQLMSQLERALEELVAKSKARP